MCSPLIALSRNCACHLGNVLIFGAFIHTSYLYITLVFHREILILIKKSYIIQIYSGITSGRVLDGERLYTEILEGNIFAFAYRLFHEDFSPI